MKRTQTCDFANTPPVNEVGQRCCCEALLALAALKNCAVAMDGGAVTVFEVLALERLMPYLRGALKYVIAVAAERHPRLLALHARGAKRCAWCCRRLEGHALAAHGASFSEHFYGLRRARRPPPRRPRRASYRTRLAAAAAARRPGVARAKLDPHLSGAARRRPPTPPPPSAPPPPPPSAPPLGAAYRFCCAAADALHLGQVLLFMFERSPHPSLALRCLGLRLRRADPAAALSPPPPPPTPPQVVAGRAPPPLPPPPPPRGARRRRRRRRGAVLALLALPLEHARQLLLLSVFGYRLVEVVARAAACAAAARARAAAAGAAALPAGVVAEAGVCGVCRMRRTSRRARRRGTSSARAASTPPSESSAAAGERLPADEAGLRRLYETSRPAGRESG